MALQAPAHVAVSDGWASLTTSKLPASPTARASSINSTFPIAPQPSHSPLQKLATACSGPPTTRTHSKHGVHRCFHRYPCAGGRQPRCGSRPCRCRRRESPTPPRGGHLCCQPQVRRQCCSACAIPGWLMLGQWELVVLKPSSPTARQPANSAARQPASTQPAHPYHPPPVLRILPRFSPAGSSASSAALPCWCAPTGAPPLSLPLARCATSSPALCLFLPPCCWCTSLPPGQLACSALPRPAPFCDSVPAHSALP